MAKRRIHKELLDFRRDPPSGCFARPLIESDLFHWVGAILGPEGTPYCDGLFCLKIDFPTDYPFKPPRTEFTTKVYNPSINSRGQHCLEIVDYSWSPALTISRVMLALTSLLTDPNADDPLEAEIARVYKADIQRFNATAREWTLKYAM